MDAGDHEGAVGGAVDGEFFVGFGVDVLLMFVSVALWMESGIDELGWTDLVVDEEAFFVAHFVGISIF